MAKVKKMTAVAVANRLIEILTQQIGQYVKLAEENAELRQVIARRDELIKTLNAQNANR